MLSWLNIPVSFLLFFQTMMLLVHTQFSCCKTQSMAFMKMNRKPETCYLWSFYCQKQWQFSQNYIPIFCILNPCTSREISLSLCAVVTGGSWLGQWQVSPAVTGRFKVIQQCFLKCYQDCNRIWTFCGLPLDDVVKFLMSY